MLQVLRMDEIASAAVLGIIEGLTEFIPVSSTGHLILFADLIGFQGERAKTFEIFIQLGAILAVVFLYHKRFLNLFKFSSNAADSFEGFAGIMKLIAASIPALICGALLYGPIKSVLFNSRSVAIALIFGGAVMVCLERRKLTTKISSLGQLSYRDCLIIGIFQCLSLWPGISRSASTIVGAMFLGAERKVAAEFSFLVAVPVMFAATTYDLAMNVGTLTSKDAAMFGVGFLVSLVTAVVAIKFFIKILERFTLVPFGVYRICLGILVLLVV